LNLFLCPAADRIASINYVNCVEYPVIKDEILEYLPKKTKLEFLQSKRESFSIWGVKDGKNQNIWRKILEGDKLAFFKEKSFYSVATVFKTFSNEGLAKVLFKNGKDGKTFKNLIFLENLEEIKLSGKRFNTLVGRDVKNPIRMFQRLDDDKSQLIVSEIFSNINVKSRFEAFQNKLKNIKGKTDKSVETKRRVEHDVIVDYLFGVTESRECAICSKHYPNQLLVAGHIKKRKDATRKERLDLNIVMPVCKLGCDELFEYGYIYVDENNILKKNLGKDSTIELDHFIEKLIDKKIEYVNENNKRYFHHHRIKTNQGS
jgi:hypothetical protein